MIIVLSAACVHPRRAVAVGVRGCKIDVESKVPSDVVAVDLALVQWWRSAKPRAARRKPRSEGSLSVADHNLRKQPRSGAVRQRPSAPLTLAFQFSHGTREKKTKARFV